MSEERFSYIFFYGRMKNEKKNVSCPSFRLHGTEISFFFPLFLKSANDENMREVGFSANKIFRSKEANRMNEI